MRFTDGTVDLNKDGRIYSVDQTAVGRAWIRDDALILTEPVRVRYEKRPWIEHFEFDGIRPAPARRTGIGTKGTKGFVKSLSTIYSAAYDEYYESGGDQCFDADRYFSHAAEHFAAMAADRDKAKLFAKFCGFAENMWREGNGEMLRVCLGSVIPVLQQTGTQFSGNITQEFREFLENHHNG